jgi:DNA repair exonuclease SbcCD ATPase subunit
VVLENFLSFGTPATTIEFTDDEPLWVLCGPNGVGKSAVFDAMTYALFGCHRGGKGQGMEDLVRHGTNGFRIEFEFAVDSRGYRVVRNYDGRSVEKVYRDSAGKWKEIDLAAGRNRVREWAERELGLTFEQFTASVLLRQGAADDIITSTGKNRLRMLKKIIGVERYERLADRVNNAAKEAHVRKDRASGAAAIVPAVTPDEVAAAAARQAEADADHEAKSKAERTAVERISHAKEYNRLAQVVAALTAQLDAASARRAAADRIRDDHARLTELNSVVPVLARLIPARDERNRTAPEVERLSSAETREAERVKSATSTRDAAREAAAGHKQRADEAATAVLECAAARKADESLLKVAEEVEGIEARLAEFPADLDEQLRTAADNLTAAQDAAKNARDEHVSAQTLLKQREKDSKDFGNVEVGARCSRCRQPVTAEHAENERRALADEIERLRGEANAAAGRKAQADAALDIATKAHGALTSQLKERDRYTEHRRVLAHHSAVERSAVIRARLAENEREVARLTTAEVEERGKAATADRAAKAAEADRVDADQKLSAARGALQSARDKYVTSTSAIDALVPSLTGEWATSWASVTTADLARLTAERARLEGSGVEADFRALGEDAVLDAERAKQRDDALTAIAAISEDAHISVAAAEAAAKEARDKVEHAAETLSAAKTAVQALHGRQEEHDKLVDAEKQAEKDARVHAKLNRLLGADGLQRELVRSAEQQIVHFADETVRHLSDGDLSIELDTAEDGPDKAFTLKFHRADDPASIGVAYLSGSQKFRVAVAVALGIGRFATSGTQARPLESVIIDEGFGSLDKDGLRCMADELHRLKDKLALKRVVLVSHQEEFVSRFPVGWRLSRGDAGTIAERFRR